MSTAALKTSEARHGWLRSLTSSIDLWAAVLALPLFVVAGWPIYGWVAATAIWVAQRLLQATLQRSIRQSESPRRIVGLTAAGILARGWGAAIAVLLIGLENETVGLAAALMIVALFSLYFGQKMIGRMMDAAGGGAPGGGPAESRDRGGGLDQMHACGEDELLKAHGAGTTEGRTR